MMADKPPPLEQGQQQQQEQEQEQEQEQPSLLHFNGDLQGMASSSNDREYGTFEVSVIEVDPEYDTPADERASASPCDRVVAMFSDECLFVLALLAAPFRPDTYRALLFHAANFVLALLAVAATVALHLVKPPLCIVASWRAKFRRVETRALRVLLGLDCALFNWVAPNGERVRVYGASVGAQHERGLYGMYAQLYFGGIKLLCAGVPGLMAALMFVWSLQNVAAQTLRVAASPDEAQSSLNGRSLSADHEQDVMLVVAVVAVYGCVLLLHVFAFISRQFTVFFCSQYLLYAHSN